MAERLLRLKAVVELIPLGDEGVEPICAGVALQLSRRWGRGAQQQHDCEEDDSDGPVCHKTGKLEQEWRTLPRPQRGSGIGYANGVNFAGAELPVKWEGPKEKEYHQGSGRHQRPERVGLHLPVEVEDAQGRGRIHQPVQPLPPAAQTSNPTPGRGDRQRNQEEEAGEAHRDVGSLNDVLHDVLHREELIQPHIGGQVQTEVEEGEEPQGTTYLYDAIPSADTPYRRDGQGDQQEDESPAPGQMKKCLDGIGAQPILKEPPADPSDREQTEDPDASLEGEVHSVTGSCADHS